MATDILTGIVGLRFRSVQLDRLLYLTDGLTQPKMYDGEDLVNWGITRPSSSPSVASTSSGANNLDLCETLWTPASLELADGESAWDSNDTDNVLCITSTDRKVGSLSALVYIGTSVTPIDANTKLMIHADGVDGSTSPVDSSASARTITANGNAQLDTAQFKFGTASMLFGGSGDYFSVPHSTDFEPGTGDFSVDFWFRMNTAWSGEDVLFDSAKGFGGGSGKGVCLALTGNTGVMRVFVNGSSVMSRTLVVSAGTWYHIALSREGTSLRLFLDGTQQGATVTNSADISGATETFKIGGHDASSLFTMDGWIDEFRFDKGSARFTSSFLVPTAEYGTFSTTTGDPNQVLGLAAYENLSSTQDLSGYYGLQFWIKSDKDASAGDIKLAIAAEANVNDVKEFADCPALQAGIWRQVTVQFQTPEELTSIDSIGLWIATDLGNNAIRIDDVKAIRCLVELDTSDRTEGNSSIKLTIPGNVPSGVVVAYRNLSSSQDLTGDNVILMSFKCDKDVGYQDLQFLIDQDADVASPEEEIYITTDLAKDTWHNLTLSMDDPSILNSVDSIGLKVVDRTIAPCIVRIDNVKRASTAAGNLSGRYYTWVSFYSSKYDRESDLSPISGVVDCQNQAISVSDIPTSSDPQVDMRRVYRSAAGGTVPYLDTLIPNNVDTTVTLTKSDASLLAGRKHPSEAAGSGKFAPPPSFPYLTTKDNRIIGAGSLPYSRGKVDVQNGSATFIFSGAQLDDSFIGRTIRVLGDQEEYIIESVNAGAGTCVARPIEDLEAGTYKGTTRTGMAYMIVGGLNDIYTSYIDNDNVPRPHGFPVDVQQTIEGGKSNDYIRGIGIVGDAILICKGASTHIAEGKYPPYAIDDLSDVIGCVSHDTIQTDSTGRAIWLAGESGLALCDGYNVQIMTKAVEDIFNGTHELGLNTSLLSQAHAVLDVKKDLYYLFVPSKNSSRNDVLIVLDKSAPDPANWKFYYYTGIEAASSTIIYDDKNRSSIYVGDYEGFIYQLDTGYYDGVELGTLTGSPTSVGTNSITDSGAEFYVNGDGLKSLRLVMENPDTGAFDVYKIKSNTGTSITIEGAWSSTPTTDWNYYVAAIPLEWKSKVTYVGRPTDKGLVFDAALNHKATDNSRSLRVRILKDLKGESVLDQTHDLNDSSEEAIFLVHERAAQAQWYLSGLAHGEEVTIHALGMRVKKRGII